MEWFLGIFILAGILFLVNFNSDWSVYVGVRTRHILKSRFSEEEHMQINEVARYVHETYWRTFNRFPCFSRWEWIYVIIWFPLITLFACYKEPPLPLNTLTQSREEISTPSVPDNSFPGVESSYVVRNRTALYSRLSLSHFPFFYLI